MWSYNSQHHQCWIECLVSNTLPVGDLMHSSSSGLVTWIAKCSHSESIKVGLWVWAPVERGPKPGETKTCKILQRGGIEDLSDCHDLSKLLECVKQWFFIEPRNYKCEAQAYNWKEGDGSLTMSPIWMLFALAWNPPEKHPQDLDDVN